MFIDFREERNIDMRQNINQFLSCMHPDLRSNPKAVFFVSWTMLQTSEPLVRARLISNPSTCVFMIHSTQNTAEWQ